ncbi:MAG TPA: GAP family protein [Solirubrobacteraceae bacterium]
MDIATLVALALAASVYPTLLAGVILILAHPRPLRMLFGFLFGGLTISLIAGIVIIRALESSGAVSTSSRSTQPIVSIAAGVVSLLVAWGISTGRINRALSKHERRKPDPDVPARPSLASRTLARGSIAMAFVAGLVLNLPGVWYLEALTEIAKAKPSTTSALLQLLLFNVIMFALVELPIIAYVVEPDGAAALVSRASDWGHTHSRRIAVVVATVVGAWLIIKGIINL